MCRFFLFLATAFLCVGCQDKSEGGQETGEAVSLSNSATTTTNNSPTSSDETASTTTTGVTTTGSSTTNTTSVSTTEAPSADVVGVRGEGDDGDLTVYVSVLSEETGCDQYADWWELVAEDGSLIYRRILNHSHPDEQPFERSGAGVDWTLDAPIYVRAHMAPWGYVGKVMWGTFRDGFEVVKVEPGFAAELETQDPLPEECWW